MNVPSFQIYIRHTVLAPNLTLSTIRHLGIIWRVAADRLIIKNLHSIEWNLISLSFYKKFEKH